MKQRTCSICREPGHNSKRHKRPAARDRDAEEGPPAEQDPPPVSDLELDAVGVYFRSLRRHKLLPREETQRLCEEIARHDLAVWRLLLQHGPVLPALRARATARTLETPVEVPLRFGEGAVAGLAVALRASDPDRELQRQVVGEVRVESVRQRLHAHLAAADRARERVLKANLRLAVAIANRYQGKGMALEDLIQEGNIGLMRALDRFDPQRGFAFTTYASWWVMHAIHRALKNTSREVRLPVHFEEARRKSFQAAAELEARHGHEPTREEIAAHMGIPLKAVDTLRQSWHATSLDQPVGTDGDMVLGDVLTAEEAPNPLAGRMSEQMRSELDVLMRAYLTPQEVAVLRARVGWGGQPAKTLQEVGVEHNLSRERIRQLETRALRTLRRHAPAEWAE